MLLLQRRPSTKIEIFCNGGLCCNRDLNCWISNAKELYFCAGSCLQKSPLFVLDLFCKRALFVCWVSIAKEPCVCKTLLNKQFRNLRSIRRDASPSGIPGCRICVSCKITYRAQRKRPHFRLVVTLRAYCYLFATCVYMKGRALSLSFSTRSRHCMCAVYLQRVSAARLVAGILIAQVYI